MTASQRVDRLLPLELVGPVLSLVER